MDNRKEVWIKKELIKLRILKTDKLTTNNISEGFIVYEKLSI
jgi:hypothetical protein